MRSVVASRMSRVLVFAARSWGLRNAGPLLLPYGQLFRAGMCSGGAIVAEADPDEVKAVVDGLQEYLHKQKNMEPGNAQIVAINASAFVQKALAKFKKLHKDCTPADISSKIGTVLEKMNPGKMEVFYASIGIEWTQDKARKSRLIRMFHHAVTLTDLLEALGVERKIIGSLLEQNEFVAGGKTVDVLNIFQYLASNGVTNEGFNVLCSRFPQIFTPKMKYDWEPFVHLLREHEVLDLAMRRLIKHYGELLLELKSSDFMTTVDYLQKELGLQRPELSRIFKSHPEALLLDRDKTVVSKVEFLKKYKLKKEDIARVFVRCPNVVAYSIETMEAKIDFLRSLRVREWRIRNILVAFPAILAHSLETKLKPAVAILEEAGITGDQLAILITRRPAIFAIDIKEKLPWLLQNMKEFGPEGMVIALSWGLSEGIVPFMARLRFLKSLGFKQEELVQMLSRDPRILKIHSSGLNLKTKFLTQEMGLRKDALVKNPTFLYSHFDRRIKVRYEVLKLLYERGAIPQPPQLTQIIHPDNRDFMQRYVKPYRACQKIVNKHYRINQRIEGSDHRYMMKYIDHSNHDAEKPDDL